ncbi:uncharacterized protein LOC120631540 [Pararge aegeria]|uniref:Jg15334 protein n=1 Tax=Pararge aegeria aegeria TaxID=348720 RepID=A0A8S4RIZ7_9NEOP|nr:uncharacterized protein LOC120631540 [Pararge aegeria]CAH2236575.1 jg15334 [Pararge aegeria aegeria]
MCIKLKYCCWCIPLRIGLLIWAYFSVITIYLNSLIGLYELQDLFYDTKQPHPGNYIYKIFIFLSIVIYFIFHVVLVAGLHKNSHGLLMVHKGFLTISLILESIAAALLIPLAIFRKYHEYSQIDTTVQVYLKLLKLLFYVVSILTIFFFIKVYILLCVRSMISALGYDEDGYKLEQPPETPSVIVLNNRKSRRPGDESDSSHNIPQESKRAKVRRGQRHRTV